MKEDEPSLLANGFLNWSESFLASDTGRITRLLRSEGWQVNAKRVYRLWRQEGLKVPQKTMKRRRLGSSNGGITRRKGRAQRSRLVRRFHLRPNDQRPFVEDSCGHWMNTRVNALRWRSDRKIHERRSLR